MSHVPPESAPLHLVDALSCSVVHPQDLCLVIRETSPYCHWGQAGLCALGNPHCKVCSMLSLWSDGPVNMCQHEAEQQNTKELVNGVLSVVRPQISW